MTKDYLVSYKPGNNQLKTPMIRLSNKRFLESISGLNIGDTICVEYLPNAIIIKKINPQNYVQIQLQDQGQAEPISA